MNDVEHPSAAAALREQQCLRSTWARRFSQLRAGSPQKYWARRFGLSYAAVRDLEQGRVMPSRAVVLILHAIEMSPGFMEDVARRARDDLAALDGRGRSGIVTGRNKGSATDGPSTLAPIDDNADIDMLKKQPGKPVNHEGSRDERA